MSDFSARVARGMTHYSEAVSPSRIATLRAQKTRLAAGFLEEVGD
jgi:hypothetical protein